jgi:hypothetical protein
MDDIYHTPKQPGVRIPSHLMRVRFCAGFRHRLKGGQSAARGRIQAPMVPGGLPGRDRRHCAVHVSIARRARDDTTTLSCRSLSTHSGDPPSTPPFSFQAIKTPAYDRGLTSACLKGTGFRHCRSHPQRQAGSEIAAEVDWYSIHRYRTMKKRTISLVLGSGGARGYAHIGVIGWLKDHGFAIRSIAGSSMGALIGGIYATGKLDAYAEWVRALDRSDVLQLLDLSFGRSGLFKGERVMRALQDLIGEYDIEDLPISFTAVATDLDTEKEVWLSKGPLFDALRASIAIPTLFTPFQYKGRRLVDGGLVNPLPIAPTLRDMTDLTIAVNLSGREERDLERSTVHDTRVGEPRYNA